MKIVRGLLLLAFVTALFDGNAQNWIDSLPLVKSQNQDTTIAVTHAFHVYTRRFQPSDTVFVRWDHMNSRFLIYGEASSPFENTKLHFNFGTRDSSYFQIHGNFSRSVYTPNLIDTFTIAGLSFSGKPTETQFSHDMDANQSREFIYGDVHAYLDGKWINSRLGSKDQPGMELVSGRLKEIFVLLKEQVVLKGLPSVDLSKQDILIKHEEGYPENTYYGHGTWAVFLMETIQIATLGSSSEPGLVIKNGLVDSIEMLVAGGGVIGPVIFGALPLTDVFTLSYNHSKSKYAIAGKFKIGIPLGGLVKAIGKKNIPEFEIDAGDKTHSGFLLDINTGKFTVEDVVLKLSRVSLGNAGKTGGFELNNLSLRIKENLPDSIYALVTLPGRVSVQCALSFNLNHLAHPLERFLVHSIQIQFEATSPTQGIPLGDTGFYLVKIGGGISNLNKPKELTLIADMGITVGKPFTFELSKLIKPLPGKVEMVPAYIEGEARLSAQAFSMDVTGDLYAYFSSGLWTGIFGTLDLNIDLIFGHSYNVSGLLSCYSPPHDFINASLIAHFNQSGDIDAQGSVKLKIPGDIPIIGGKTLAKAQGALRHRQGSPKESYVAGWAKINLGVDHVFAGVKVRFDDGSVSKLGAGQARVIKSQLTSDTSQHPVSGGLVQTAWHTCEITHSFTLDTEKPPAYLQNEMIFDKRLFADPANPNHYLAPISANIEPSSGSNDLKSMLPDDSLGFYNNHGQTTRPYHAVIIDLSRSSTHSHLDTIRWITVNHTVGSYSSIDWKNQPRLLLSPGQQLLTVSGYCPSSQPLSTADTVKVDISPVFPRPEISFSVNPITRALTMDYSAYLTDSTVVSVYWNGNKEYSGRLIAHLDYHQGIPIGDSTYRWVIEDWDPGILPQKQIYLYAVIDDFVNAPEYSALDSTYFDQFISGTVEGGTDSTLILLKPEDSSRHDVKALMHSSNETEGLRFGFYNVPLGRYSLYCMNNDPNRSLLAANVWNLDGQIQGYYHSEEWVSVDFTAVTWDNGIANIDFSTIEESVNLFGNVTDTSGQSVGEYSIYMLDHKDSVIQHPRVSDLGYIITNQDTGHVKLGLKLDDNNYFHWPRTNRRKYFTHDGLFGLYLIVDSIDIGAESKGLDFKAIEGPQGPIFIANDTDNRPVPGVVFSLKKNEGTGPTLHAITDRDGLAYLEADEVTVNTSYVVTVSWPEHYKADSPTSQHYQWYGTTDPFLVTARIK